MTDFVTTDLGGAAESLLAELPTNLLQGIHGVGVDIASIDRIKLAIDRSGERFLNFVYTQSEQEYCEQAEKKFERYSACWAAKEAAVKALGTGFRQAISFKDIELCSGQQGKPELSLSGQFSKLMQQKNVTYSHVSISHEGNSAIAFVVLCRT